MNKSMRARGRGATASMAATLVLCAATASASGIPVVDIANTLQATMNQVNTYTTVGQNAAEYSATAMRWMQTYRHYQQQLIKIQGLIMSFGLPGAQSLSKVEPNFMVAERCGQGFSLPSLGKVLGLNPDGNIIEQQKQLCVNIQRMENTKFNYTVDFLQEYLPKLQSELKQVESQRSASNDQGNVEGVSSNSLQLANSSDVNFQEWESNIKAYDSYIAVMENHQRLLARVAMKGKGNPLGTLIKTSALKSALDAGH